MGFFAVLIIAFSFLDEKGATPTAAPVVVRLFTFFELIQLNDSKRFLDKLPIPLKRILRGKGFSIFHALTTNCSKLLDFFGRRAVDFHRRFRRHKIFLLG
jgi:hypothetical protein